MLSGLWMQMQSDGGDRVTAVLMRQLDADNVAPLDLAAAVIHTCLTQYQQGFIIASQVLNLKRGRKHPS